MSLARTLSSLTRSPAAYVSNVVVVRAVCMLIRGKIIKMLRVHTDKTGYPERPHRVLCAHSVPLACTDYTALTATLFEHARSSMPRFRPVFPQLAACTCLHATQLETGHHAARQTAICVPSLAGTCSLLTLSFTRGEAYQPGTLEHVCDNMFCPWKQPHTNFSHYKDRKGKDTHE